MLRVFNKLKGMAKVSLDGLLKYFVGGVGYRRLKGKGVCGKGSGRCYPVLECQRDQGRQFEPLTVGLVDQDAL